MIKVETTNFGIIEIDEEQLLDFPCGIPGFEDLTRWCLFHLEQNTELCWMQAVDEPSVALLLADPDQLFRNYDLEISSDQLGPLELSEADEHSGAAPVVMRVVLRRDADEDAFVANLQAPMLFNLSNRKGMQLVLDRPKFSARQKLEVVPKVDEVLPGFQREAVGT